MTSSQIMTSQMSWKEFADRIASGAIVLVPVGAHEQHGHHLPLGTDVAEVTAVCHGVADRINAVVAPPIPFGYKSQPRSGAGNHWPGNIALEGDTLVRLVRDVILALAAHADRIAVIDGHFENGWFLIEACDLAARRIQLAGGKARVVRLMAWDAIPADAWDRIYQSSGPVDLSLAHAGLIEAAAMLHLAPESVHLERESEDDYRSFPAYDVYPPDPAFVPRSGTLSSPHAATSELGRFIIETMSENVARLLFEAFELPTTAQPGSGSVQP